MQAFPADLHALEARLLDIQEAEVCAEWEASPRRGSRQSGALWHTREQNLSGAPCLLHLYSGLWDWVGAGLAFECQRQ